MGHEIRYVLKDQTRNGFYKMVDEIRHLHNFALFLRCFSESSEIGMFRQSSVRLQFVAVTESGQCF
jgi:hypothetical protein